MGINEYTCHDEKENSQSRCTPCCELVAGVEEAVLLALNPGGLLHFMRNEAKRALCLMHETSLNAQNRMEEIHFIKAAL